MEKLFQKHTKKVNTVNLKFVRETINKIQWKDRLIGIKGARGVGKTTLLLQYIKKNFKNDLTNLYVSLDDLYFTENTLTGFAEDFINNGGKILFLDEVHRYKNWAQEIKNLYDDYPELKIVFTGSSILNIVEAKADLSRRAVFYNMQGLSFREYLNFVRNTNFQKLTLNDILENHIETAGSLTAKLNPLPDFKKYLQSGYYPFFIEYYETYHLRIEQIIDIILAYDIPSLKSVSIEGIENIKKLLFVISTSSPFKPNISKLSERIGISRNSLTIYLNYLKEAHLLHLLYKDSGGISLLQKPEKIYFENSNLIYALSQQNSEVGSIRETFFINQLSEKHSVRYSEKSDFFIDDKFTFEIGGKNKTTKQIQTVPNSFVVADDIEIGFKNKIPLWLFGFLY